MIKFDDDAMVKLYDLSYGVDIVDERLKYFATYSYEADGYRVFVEIKTMESIAFPRAALLSKVKEMGGGQARFRFEGALDYGLEKVV